MIQIPGFPDYFVNETNIISTKYGKHKVLKQSINSKGYKQVVISDVNKIKKACVVHRLIAQAYLKDFSEDLQVDHKDRNKLNNDISNLRMVSDKENKENKDCKGCYLEKTSNLWRARIRKNKKTMDLGSFDTEEEATEAYLKAKQIHHPFFTHEP